MPLILCKLGVGKPLLMEHHSLFVFRRAGVVVNGKGLLGIRGPHGLMNVKVSRNVVVVN